MSSTTASDPEVNRLNLDAIRTCLNTRRLGVAAGWTNELWDSIESTNSRAAELAAMGAADGVMVLARQQTAGRGRQGRTWISPPDAGIYVSFLLRPTGSVSDLPLYTIATGVACAQAIYECAGIRIGLKWVNDMVYEGRKLGGILAEIPSTTGGDAGISKTTSTRALIIGIGINLSLEESSIPEELNQRIDCLERISATPINPNVLVATVANKLELVCADLEAGKTESIRKEWKEFSVTLGRSIQTTVSGQSVTGQAVDIAGDGALIVQTTDGKTIILSGGEITIRSADGNYV